MQTAQNSGGSRARAGWEARKSQSEPDGSSVEAARRGRRFASMPARRSAAALLEGVRPREGASSDPHGVESECTTVERPWRVAEGR